MRKVIATLATAIVITPVPLACQGRSDTPEGALREFLSAGDLPNAAGRRWQLLASETRRALEQEATRLTSLTQGAVKRDPRDFIDVLAPNTAPGERPVPVEETPSRVVLRVTLARGGHSNITVIREDGRWRLLFPVDGVPLFDVRENASSPDAR